MDRSFIIGFGSNPEPDENQHSAAFKSYEAAYRLLSQDLPECVTRDSTLKEKLSATWAIVAQNLEESWWFSDIGRALIGSFNTLANRLEAGAVTDNDLTILKKFATPIPDVTKGNLVQGSLSMLYMLNIMNQHDRESAFELFDKAIQLDSSAERAAMGVVLNGFAISYGLQRKTEGAFNLIYTFANELQKRNAFHEINSAATLLMSVEKLPINQFMVDAYERSLTGGSDTTIVHTGLRHILAYQLVKSVFHSTTTEALSLYRRATGGMPMGLWQNRQRTPWSGRIMKNTAALFDSFEGFAADTFMARRTPEQFGRSLYDRFGSDIGTVRLLNHSGREGFPGPGLILQDIDLKLALSAHYKEGAEDPISTYRTIWDTTGHVLQALPDSRFFISRALLAITGPDTEMYSIQPVPNKPAISYSLVICNVNHGNETNDIAYLVPTQILDAKFTNTSVQARPVTDIPDPLCDINKSGLRIAELRQAAHAIGYPVIAVGSPVVASGSYEYAIDREFISEPLPLSRANQYESHASHFRQIFDSHADNLNHETIYGHTVPGFVDDIWLHGLERRELRPGRIHTDIAILTEKLTELWQGVRYIRANWTKGNTAVREEVDFQFTHKELQAALQAADLPQYWNGNCVRMLVEAYRWNAACTLQHGNLPEHFPVLVAASSQWYSGRSHINPILIDTYANPADPGAGMLFRDQSGIVHTLNAPTRGKSLDDALFFIKHVLRHLTSDATELRFVDRRLVGWNEANAFRPIFH